MSYCVLVDNNFQCVDENYRRNLGEFPTYSEALAVCQEVVDRFLGHEYVPGMAESALYFRYMMFGQDPFIAGGPGSPDSAPGFSAWDYAKVRCSEFCGATPQAVWPPGAAEHVEATIPTWVER